MTAPLWLTTITIKVSETQVSTITFIGTTGAGITLTALTLGAFMTQYVTLGLAVAGDGTPAGVLMLAGVGDHSGVLAFGAADGIHIIRTGPVTTKAFTKAQMIFVSDVTEFILVQEVALGETVLIISIHAQEFRGAAHMPIPVLLKIMVATTEEPVPLVGAHALVMQT